MLINILFSAHGLPIDSWAFMNKNAFYKVSNKHHLNYHKTGTKVVHMNVSHVFN